MNIFRISREAVSLAMAYVGVLVGAGANLQQQAQLAGGAALLTAGHHNCFYGF